MKHLDDLYDIIERLDENIYFDQISHNDICELYDDISTFLSKYGDMKDIIDTLSDDDIESINHLKSTYNTLKIMKSLNVDMFYTVEGLTDHAYNEAESIFGDSINQWPLNTIDWDEAALALSIDYDTIMFLDTTLFYRVK